jgi:hypothetical protein
MCVGIDLETDAEGAPEQNIVVANTFFATG